MHACVYTTEEIKLIIQKKKTKKNVEATHRENKRRRKILFWYLFLLKLVKSCVCYYQIIPRFKLIMVIQLRIDKIVR